jgi:hypothetical protein
MKKFFQGLFSDSSSSPSSSSSSVSQNYTAQQAQQRQTRSSFPFHGFNVPYSNAYVDHIHTFYIIQPHKGSSNAGPQYMAGMKPT